MLNLAVQMLLQKCQVEMIDVQLLDLKGTQPGDS